MINCISPTVKPLEKLFVHAHLLHIFRAEHFPILSCRLILYPVSYPHVYFSDSNIDKAADHSSANLQSLSKGR